MKKNDVAYIRLVLALSLALFGCGGGIETAGTYATPETSGQQVSEAPVQEDPQQPVTPGTPEQPVADDPVQPPPQPPATPGSPDPPVAELLPQPPAAPQGLTAVPEVERVRLSWQATVGATGYLVYWNETGGVTTADLFEPVEIVPQLEHTGLTSGTAYAYRVAAFSEVGEGPLSAEVAAVPASPAVAEQVRSDSAP